MNNTKITPVKITSLLYTGPAYYTVIWKMHIDIENWFKLK